MLYLCGNDNLKHAILNYLITAQKPKLGCGNLLIKVKKPDNRPFAGNGKASLAIQQLFPIQILLIFLRFEQPPNFIFQCYRPQTWQSTYFCLLFSFLVLGKCQVLNLMVGIDWYISTQGGRSAVRRFHRC